jgi:hypothetical protein
MWDSFNSKQYKVFHFTYTSQPTNGGTLYEPWEQTQTIYLQCVAYLRLCQYKAVPQDKTTAHHFGLAFKQNVIANLMCTNSTMFLWCGEAVTPQMAMRKPSPHDDDVNSLATPRRHSCDGSGDMSVDGGCGRVGKAIAIALAVRRRHCYSWRR